MILILWAGILTLVACSRMLLLSVLVGANSQAQVSQGQIWGVFIINAVFGLGFAASVYGLWIRRHWGRLLFAGLIVVWAVFYLVAILGSSATFIQRDGSPGMLLLNTIPYLIGSGVTVWYLNLAHIKALFDPEERIGE
jgi:hypothetical protein